MEQQLRREVEQQRSSSSVREVPLWEEYKQIKRRRYRLQDQLRRLPGFSRLVLEQPTVLPPEPGERGRLVQLAFNVLLNPSSAFPLSSDTILEQMLALDSHTKGLLAASGFSRVDELLYWMEQRYPDTMQTCADCFGANYRSFFVESVNRDELASLYMRIYQELPPALDDVDELPPAPLPASDVEELLAIKSVNELKEEAIKEQALALLTTPSVGDLKELGELKSKDGPAVREFCPFLLRDNCPARKACPKLHFVVLINANTDKSSGDCPYLDTCRNIDRCRYLHYELEEGSLPPNLPQLRTTTSPPPPEAEWICCDIRKLDFDLIGKFGVIVADPPWDIHMELPYGTMTDEEMLKLPVTRMQDSGYIFLWVTGRAMELGRECMVAWGYERIEELVWVKTNQVQRMLRAGRTGHWLNHSKEHCLIGVKGNVSQAHIGVDCDVIVAPLRETSRKPEELYSIIERLTPGMRRVELFGRPHNLRNGWLTLGNQLDGVRLRDPAMQQRVTTFLANLREETAKQQQQQQQA